ncbi:MAG TPA: DNA-3-methyladenine glycosylase I [Candidatus Limnocylindria bacterium]|nr:DNA-3-methyladenine glycosylase I [Candidatus Limnocylindria bacterium]
MKGGRGEAPALNRCTWAVREPLLSYHDEEWGTPQHDERVLFEFLVLEGAQAGLSWETILRKRDAYRRAFARFDPAKVARFGARDVARLLRDEGIVRNRAKITSAVDNARAFLAVAKEHGSVDAFVWRFTDPTELSRELRGRGFRFVGPTICESFMEAVGILDHHERGCFRRGKAPRPPERRAQRKEGGRR